MVHEQTEAEDLLNCECCLQLYDENSPLGILPCCGKTICNTCVQLKTKQTKDN